MRCVIACLLYLPASLSHTGTSTLTVSIMKTIAIIGGTGGTGKWAVKGALLKGYKVGDCLDILLVEG